MPLGGVLSAKLGAEVTSAAVFLSAYMMGSRHKEIRLVGNAWSEMPRGNWPIIE